MKLGYRSDGSERLPVLVLSGALGTTMSLWEPQLPELTARYRVLRHDLPGHGESPLPDEPVTVEAIGRALLDVLAALRIGRASVCGISMGGMVAMWLGANAPERVDGVVLACTGATLGTPELYENRAALVRREGVAPVLEGARERWFTPAFRDSAAAQRVLDQLRTTPPEGYAACAEAVGRFDFRDELGRVSPPALVLTGSEDPVTPPEVTNTLVRGLPNATHMALAGAAHLANVEQPVAFTSALVGHLEERTVA